MKAVKLKVQWSKVFLYSGRIVVVALLIATFWQVAMLFRAMNQDAGGRPSSAELDQVAEIAPPELPPMFQGEWTIASEDESTRIGRLSEKQFQSLLQDLRSRYDESEIAGRSGGPDHARFSGFANLLGLSQNGPVAQYVFEDSNQPHVSTRVSAFRLPSDDWVYLLHQTGYQVDSDSSVTPTLLDCLAAEYAVLMQKRTEQRTVVLEWLVSNVESGYDRNRILKLIEGSGIDCRRNFPEAEDRFDYTCKSDQFSFRLLGSIDADKITDLIVIRL